MILVFFDKLFNNTQLLKDPSPALFVCNEFIQTFLSHLPSLPPHSFFFFFNLFIFNWRIIALQYCLGFYQIATWISHDLDLTMSPPLEHPSHLPPHPTPLGCYWALVWVPWVTQQIPMAIYLHMVTYVSMLHSPHKSPSLSSLTPAVSRSLFSMSVSPLLLCK